MEILGKTNIDLVLLDIRMPGIDGYVVAQNIREKFHDRNIPVIAFTASVLNKDSFEKNENFSGVLFKPAKRAELLGQLIKYLKYESITKVDDVIGADVAEQLLNNMSDNEIKNLPLLYDKLANQYKDDWETFKDSLVLYKIETFATELEQLGVKNRNKYLLHYVKQLTEALEIFDLMTLKELVQMYPAILEKIKTKLK